ncbi:MAG TPA: type IV pilus twitching motility protein PilT [Candidatus Polarisedimenticolia bacterium]|jgi:twitching motility protein PilT
MPRIDRFLHPLSQRGAMSLIMSSGERVVLETHAGPRSVTTEAVTPQQILGFLREILPPGMESAIDAGQGCAFTYASPEGVARIEVTGTDRTLRLAAALAGPEVPGPGVSNPLSSPAIHALFAMMVQEKCSDLHLSTGNPPLFRKDGEIVPLGDATPLDASQIQDLLYGITPSHCREQFEKTHDSDFSYEIPGLARFRCNIFMDRVGAGGVFRVIPTKIPPVEELGLGKAILDLCHLNKGLVVVTGPTGSGKSTTLASMIDYINRNRSAHIITIEDPIEFVHANRKCLINQREVGTHTEGFKQALRAALREDPDIVLVGEMRDLETVAIAIETAETGHLVFGTLHTNTAPSTVDRIIDQFSSDRQAQVRTMLSESLKGVLSQTLCKKKGGGRVAALEVLIVNSAISNLIREGKTFQIPSLMQTGKGVGMVCLNDALLDLVTRGLVDPAEALARAVGKAELKALLNRSGAKAEIA